MAVLNYFTKPVCTLADTCPRAQVSNLDKFGYGSIIVMRGEDIPEGSDILKELGNQDTIRIDEYGKGCPYNVDVYVVSPASQTALGFMSPIRRRSPLLFSTQIKWNSDDPAEDITGIFLPDRIPVPLPGGTVSGVARCALEKLAMSKSGSYSLPADMVVPGALTTLAALETRGLRLRVGDGRTKETMTRVGPFYRHEVKGFWVYNLYETAGNMKVLLNWLSSAIAELRLILPHLPEDDSHKLLFSAVIANDHDTDAFAVWLKLSSETRKKEFQLALPVARRGLLVGLIEMLGKRWSQHNSG